MQLSLRAAYVEFSSTYAAFLYLEAGGDSGDKTRTS